MEFPVDVLDGTSYEELELSAHAYMNKLLYSDPDHPQRFTLGSGRKVQISLSSVGFVPLHGANVQHKVLALFTPQDQFTAVALFLANQWYSVEDILKTANPTQEGLVEVRSVGERIVLYTLNRIVYRTSEMTTGELPFLCHGETAYAKILWKSGEAVGFYSVKTKGSICDNSLRQCYFLPVMDSIFVRKAHRGQKHGFQMLEDFVDSFKENELGMKYPLTPAMARVCRHYLDCYPADVDLLWEVEGVGGPYQRTRIAKKLFFWPVNADIYKGGHGEDSDRSEALEEDRVETAEDAVLDISEEVLVADNSCKIAEDISTPISTRTRSSEQRTRKRMRDEVEENWVEVWPKKIKRVQMAKEQDEGSVSSDGSTTEGNDNAVDTSDEPAAANVNMASEKQQEEVVEVELYPIARVHKIEESLFLAEEEGVDEEKLEHKIVSTVEVVRAGEQNKISLAEEEMEQHDVTPMAEKEKEADYVALMQIETAPVAQEENEATSAGKKQQISPMVQKKKGAAEKQMEAGLAAKEEREVAPATMEMKAAFAVEEQIEAAPSVKEMDAAPAPEEMDTTPAPEEMEAAPAPEELEAAPAAEERVVAPAADQMQTAPAVREETQTAPAAKESAVTPVADQTKAACADREEPQAAPAAEENVVAPAVRKERQAALAVDDKQGVTPIAEKELEVDYVAVNQMEVVPTVEEAALAATEKLQKGTLAKHEFKVSSPAKEKGFVPANVEKKKVRAEPNQENCVSFASQEVKEVICATEKTSNITASEEEQGHDKDIYAANDVDEEIFVTFDLPSDGESQGSLEKEDEQEHGSMETSNFQDLQETEIKAYPSTPICASKRLCKGDLVPEEEDEVADRQKKPMVRDAKGAGAAEDKLEEIDHSSVEEEQEENPPVIERRVLRRKTRVVQAKLRSKAKRHSKI